MKYQDMFNTSSNSTLFFFRYNASNNREAFENFAIYRASMYVNNIYLWVIFAFGFPGNTFSIVTILRMKPRVKSSLYVAILAVVDNFCLLCKLLFITFTRYGVPIQDQGCASLEYLGMFTGQLANWVLVAMTLDRCVDITMPLRSLKFGKKWHFTFLGSIAVFLLVLNLPYLVTTRYMKTWEGDYTCRTSPKLKFLADCMEWIDVAVYALIPSALLTIMSFLIFRALRRSSVMIKNVSHQREVIVKREKSQRDITIMILITCSVFTLLVTPRPLLAAIVSQHPPDSHSRTAANIEFVGQIFYLLSDSSHAVDFCLYFLSNGRFRKRFLQIVSQLICKCCCCCKHLKTKTQLSMRTNPTSTCPTVWTTNRSQNGTENNGFENRSTVDLVTPTSLNEPF